MLPSGPFLVVGLARSGLSAAKLLAARGETVSAVDAGMPAGVAGLSELGVEVALDALGLDQLESTATLVKSPGVPAEAPVVVEAKRRGIRVIGEMELAWRLIPGPVIAVTGTNGKTTTVEMIGHVYRNAGHSVEVAGNVGRPLSALAGAAPGPEVTTVCEASSFQLEDTELFAPECSVFLNLSPDHLDRHGSLDAYVAAKYQVFANQAMNDIAVVNADDPSSPAETVAQRVRFSASGDLEAAEVGLLGSAVIAEGRPVFDVTELQVLGAHNVSNAMAATACCLAMGLEAGLVADGMRSFEGVAHRLEPVAEREGVLFVNDSKATNVEAAVTGLHSFAGPVRAILGGSRKGEDFGPLADALKETSAACYLIGEAAGEIEAAVAPTLEAAAVPVIRCQDLADAIAHAAADAKAGEVVLLSPACASFDAFRDYEERGAVFRSLVEALP